MSGGRAPDLPLVLPPKILRAPACRQTRQPPRSGRVAWENDSSSEFGEQQQPLLWLRGHGIYATHFVVLVLVVSMLFTTLMMALRAGFWFAWLPFDSAAVLQGQAWRILSYGLVNPPTLGFVIDMLMIVWFGRELEKFFGRRLFLTLYGSLYLLPPLLFTVIGLWQPMGLAGQQGSFALFVAFATLYPNAVLLFNLLAKWVALVLVAIYTLMFLANRDATGLLALWSTVGFAHGFVRVHQGRWSLPSLAAWRRRRAERNFQVLPPPSTRADRAPDPATGTLDEADALLEKIARSGIASLTAKERKTLELARAELLKRQAAQRRDG